MGAAFSNFTDFYPRPPRGGRHNSLNGWATDIKFLSTPSARRATEDVRVSRQRRGISIHALREEGDLSRHLGAVPP